MSPAASPSAAAPPTVTESVFATLDPESFPVDQRLGKLFSRPIVDPLNRRPGDVHLGGALLLGESLQVDETDRFVLVNGQVNGPLRAQVGVERAEAVAVGKGADFSPLFRSGHGSFTSMGYGSNRSLLRLLPLLTPLPVPAPCRGLPAGSSAHPSAPEAVLSPSEKGPDSR